MLSRILVVRNLMAPPQEKEIADMINEGLELLQERVQRAIELIGRLRKENECLLDEIRQLKEEAEALREGRKNTENDEIPENHDDHGNDQLSFT